MIEIRKRCSLKVSGDLQISGKNQIFSVRFDAASKCDRTQANKIPRIR